MTQPMIELQRQVTEIIRPLAEFKKNMSTILLPLAEYLMIASAVEVLGKNQFVFWSYISKDFALEIIQSEDINGLMFEYYTRNETRQIKETIQACESNKLIRPYTKLFPQSISSYNHKQYHLAIMGLLGVVDGLLTDVSKKPGTHIESRAKIILDKLSDDVELSQEDFSVWFLYTTFMDIIKSIGTSVPFDSEEPEFLNRHWIMHGRTKKKISQLDCVKIINLVYGILLFDKLNSDDAY